MRTEGRPDREGSHDDESHHCISDDRLPRGGRRIGRDRTPLYGCPRRDRRDHHRVRAKDGQHLGKIRHPSRRQIARRQVRWVASATSYGVINKTRPNSPALSLLRLPRSLNATAPKAQRNLPAFTSYVCLMRAREAPSSGATDRPAGAPMRLTRSSRRCGCRPTSTRRILFRAFHFSDFRIGANDGARAVSGAGEVANDVDGDRRRRVSAGLVGAAAGEVGGERHELRGHQQNAAKFSGTLTATLASLAQRYGSESSAEFARVHQLCLSHACARGAIERCHRPTRRCADATDAIEPALRLPADVDAPD